MPKRMESIILRAKVRADKGAACVNNQVQEKKSGSRRSVAIILLLLLLLLLLSGAVLACRIGGFSWFRDKDTIPIGDDVSSGESSDGGNGDQGNEGQPSRVGICVTRDVEIFRTSYTSEGGTLIARSNDGSKIVAPGTSWSYDFEVENVGSVTVSYKLTMEAVVEGTDQAIPIQARLLGPKERWITEPSGGYVPLALLNHNSDEWVLSPGRVANYRLDWEWPFESGNDGLDSLLAELPEGQDVTVTIRIHINAEEDTTGREGGVSPGTGDDFAVGLWLTLMILSLFAFVFVLAGGRKKRDA